jgi:hypothetical protein
MGTSKRAFAIISIVYWFSREGVVVIKVKLETRVDGQDIQTSDHHPGLVMRASARCNHMCLLDVSRRDVPHHIGTTQYDARYQQ